MPLSFPVCHHSGGDRESSAIRRLNYYTEQVAARICLSQNIVDWIISSGFCTLNQCTAEAYLLDDTATPTEWPEDLFITLRRYTAENAPWMMHFAVSRPLEGVIQKRTELRAFRWEIPKWETSTAPPGIPTASLRPRQLTNLLINDEELSHHAQVFVIKDVAVEHIWSVFSGIRVESGRDNDLAFVIHQHGVLPT